MAVVRDETYPYVEVNMGPINGIKTAHTLVVLSVDKTTVIVYDLMRGESALLVENFMSAWE